MLCVNFVVVKIVNNGNLVTKMLLPSLFVFYACYGDVLE
jgi:hypothetical protein